MIESSPASSALLARLRAGTREQHARLDSMVGDVVLTSTEGYATFLVASLLSVCAVERGIAHNLGPNFVALRAERIRSDLLVLGGPITEEKFPAFAPAVVPDEAAAWGCAYVVEGSALGGMVLAQRVRAALGTDAPLGYLSLRGSATPTYWREFLGRLARFASGASEEQITDAVAAARSTFDLYLSAFERVLRPGR